MTTTTTMPNMAMRFFFRRRQASCHRLTPFFAVFGASTGVAGALTRTGSGGP